MAPGDVSISSHQEPLKVSTISTTNEKDGVNIARSDEVPGNFSADKSAVSVAGKSGSLSLDALAKAKKALQMQRELSEKLKKIPLVRPSAISLMSVEFLVVFFGLFYSFLKMNFHLLALELVK